MELQFRCMERSEADLALFQATFERSGSPRTLEHLRWQYLNNPTDRINVEFALTNDGSKVAAIYSVMPVNLKIGQEVAIGCQSLDTLTDVEFRGKGLFVKMANSVFVRSQAEGYACVYGFPNGNSAHGFFGRLGWTQLDPVPFLFKPLRLNYALRHIPYIGKFAEKLPKLPIAFTSKVRLKEHQEFKEISSFDVSYDDLWNRFSAGIAVAVHRNAEYLNWRLVAKPNESYSRLGFYENGILRGFVAWTVKGKHGGQVGYLMELIFDPELPHVAKILMRYANQQMSIAGAEVVLAWSLQHSPNYSSIRKCGYWPLPEWMRPIELHAGARRLWESNDTDPCKRSNWYFSYLDSDTV